MSPPSPPRGSRLGSSANGRMCTCNRHCLMLSLFICPKSLLSGFTVVTFWLASSLPRLPNFGSRFRALFFQFDLVLIPRALWFWLTAVINRNTAWTPSWVWLHLLKWVCVLTQGWAPKSDQQALIKTLWVAQEHLSAIDIRFLSFRGATERVPHGADLNRRTFRSGWGVPVCVLWSVIVRWEAVPSISPLNGCLCVVLVADLREGWVDLQLPVALASPVACVCSRWSCSLAVSPAFCRNCVSCRSSISATRDSSKCSSRRSSAPATITRRTMSSCNKKWAACCWPPSYRYVTWASWHHLFFYM